MRCEHSNDTDRLSNIKAGEVVDTFGKHAVFSLDENYRPYKRRIPLRTS